MTPFSPPATNRHFDDIPAAYLPAWRRLSTWLEATNSQVVGDGLIAVWNAHYWEIALLPIAAIPDLPLAVAIWESYAAGPERWRTLRRWVQHYALYGESNV